MLTDNSLKYIRNAALALPLAALPMKAAATDFTAGIVMEKMSPVERSAYLAGVIEGLAYARYARDGKADGGMKCIYQWFYEKEGTLKKIHAAFDHFKDYLPGAVIAAMLEKECGA
jgi:hypothetical protein